MSLENKGKVEERTRPAFDSGKHNPAKERTRDACERDAVAPKPVANFNQEL
jgi:hypothetical protein